MSNFYKAIITLVAVTSAATSIQAQTYNDTVRTKTWSVYAETGLNTYHGARGALYDDGKVTFSPEFDLGFKYNIKPWVRVGFNVDYSALKSTNQNILSETSTKENFKIGDHTTTLNIQSNRLQNRNTLHLLGADANVDFNILQIWPNRGNQWLNLYAGTGIGYAHGWNRNTQTWSYKESAVAQGDAYYNVYSHAYIDSFHGITQVDALYIPVTLSLEADINRQLTIGVFGRYKYFPLDIDMTPTGLCTAGVVVRFNFVKSKNRILNEKVSSLNSQLVSSEKAYAQDKAAIEKKAADAQNDLKNRLAEVEKNLEDCQNAPAQVATESIHILFENASSELSSQACAKLDAFAESLKADGSKHFSLVASASKPGSSSMNQKLSDQRLFAVVNYLASKGVSKERIYRQASIGSKDMTADPDCRSVYIIAD